MMERLIVALENHRIQRKEKIRFFSLGFSSFCARSLSRKKKKKMKKKERGSRGALDRVFGEQSDPRNGRGYDIYKTLGM